MCHLMEVVLLHSSSNNLQVLTLYNWLFELQSFLKKDNFTSKFAKGKENVKLCIVRIEKKFKHKNI